MEIRVGKKFVVEMISPRGLGTNQIVRVYRKVLFFRRRLSSNWFLDQAEAERYARNTAAELELQNGHAGVQSPALR